MEYAIKESPMGKKRNLKVIFMGMGCSGINFAYQLKKQTEDIELVVYEKNDDIGGTWLENKYPGCACDIPSACYQFTWCLKPDWTHFYSRGPEIQQYLKEVVAKYDLDKVVRFGHRVKNAEWLNDQGQWRVTVVRSDGSTFDDHAHFFIHGGGVLNTWKWPDVKGLHKFEGNLLHTARWDESVDFYKKKVLQIGVGSSGLQVMPQIAEKVDHLYVVARSPTWVLGGFPSAYAGPDGRDFAYSEETKQCFQQDPVLYLSYCKAIESELNVRFKLLIKDSPDAKAVREHSVKEMRRKLSNRPEIADKLIPQDFNVGCRRPTPGNDFLEILCSDKTSFFLGEISEITGNGFKDPEGEHHEVDVIVCATGFDTTFRPQFPIVANGRNLQDEWADEVVGYLGFSAPEVPNYWIFIGPYGPLGHGSVIPIIEAYTNYIIKVLKKVQIEDIKKLQVKRRVAEDFTRHADLYMERTSWSGPCSSWFKAGDKSRKPVCYPGSRVHYMSMLQNPRYEDYEIEYLSGNTFNFMGNGFEQREFDGRDISWYYGLIDQVDEQSSTFPEPMH